MTLDIEARVAVLEARVETSFHEHTAIFARMDASAARLDATNEKIGALVRRQDKNDVYMKVLWPAITVLSSVITFLLGGKIL